MRGLPGRCHAPVADRRGQFAVDVHHPYRLIFEPANGMPADDLTKGRDVWERVDAVRIVGLVTSHSGAIAAWLRIGELKAAQISCAPFNKAALQAELHTLRRLTRDPDPNSWWPTIQRTCATVGVAVVGEPEISGARINGAARWLSPDKAIVQLSFRHKWSDIVWFTVFHEVAHLLMHSKKDAFINDPGVHSGHEQEADAYASQLLIPRRQRQNWAPS
jgi:HTH-type transcriptional regulator / antitoxin HigA